MDGMEEQLQREVGWGLDLHRLVVYSQIQTWVCGNQYHHRGTFAVAAAAVVVGVVVVVVAVVV